MKTKIIIYQIFTRLFGNRKTTRKEWGTLAENGVGKMNDIQSAQLRQMRRLGITHVWYTGIIRHATDTDYTQFGIPSQNPQVVKGIAGSPYAIVDYYDVDPDLAVSVPDRMSEFEASCCQNTRCRTKGHHRFRAESRSTSIPQHLQTS